MIYSKAIRIFCLLILILEVTCLQRKDRIVSGSIVKKRKYPFMASIRGEHPNNQFMVCGGTIIKNIWILTAAHCIIKEKPSKLFVHVGSNAFAEGEEHSVAKIFSHPKYDGEYNDIGLIKLKEPISPKKAERIVLNRKRDVDEGIMPTIIGWGKTSKDSRDIPDLREVKVKIVDCNGGVAEIIRSVFGFRIIDSRIICTSTDDGAGACKGDSGGPLIYKNKQIGIVSRGEPCATGTPDIFTNVANYIKWVETVISDESDN